MEQYIPKSALVAKIERMIKHYNESAKEFGDEGYNDNVLMEQCKANTCEHILSFLDTLEVKEVDLIIHTIIAECCDWLAMNTELSHGEIEGCRNLMLTVKDEQLKAQKGE